MEPFFSTHLLHILGPQVQIIQMIQSRVSPSVSVLHSIGLISVCVASYHFVSHFAHQLILLCISLSWIHFFTRSSDPHDVYCVWMFPFYPSSSLAWPCSCNVCRIYDLTLLTQWWVIINSLLLTHLLPSWVRSSIFPPCRRFLTLFQRVPNLWFDPLEWPSEWSHQRRVTPKPTRGVII